MKESCDCENDGIFPPQKMYIADLKMDEEGQRRPPQSGLVWMLASQQLQLLQKTVHFLGGRGLWMDGLLLFPPFFNTIEPLEWIGVAPGSLYIK